MIVKIPALFERLMEIHSNSPKLYYGFKWLQMDKDVLYWTSLNYQSYKQKTILWFVIELGWLFIVPQFMILP